LYHDQRQLVPLEQILEPQHEPAPQEQEPAYHAGGGQQYQAGSAS
jgi:PHS family inorganic phosphate transporter-like MFS transporter